MRHHRGRCPRRVASVSGGRRLTPMGKPSVGAQIGLLRKRLSRDQQEMADALGLDGEEMADLEAGRRSASAGDVASAAEFLRVSSLAILEPDSLLARLPVAKRSNGDDHADQDVMLRLTSLAELNHVLTEGGHPPASDIPQSHNGTSTAKHPKAWLQHACELAELALERISHDWCRDNPFLDLAQAIEDELGVDVMVESFDSANAPLAAAITDPDFSFILINADQRSPIALFSLAHELGHVLHHDGNTQMQIDHHLRAEHDRSERAANAFAANLLMPESRVRSAVANHDHIVEALYPMLISFGVSYETLIYRLHNLQIINANGRDSLMDYGWHGLRESANSNFDALLRNRWAYPGRRPPSLLTRRCLTGVLGGTVGAAPLARLLNADIEDILGGLVMPFHTTTVAGMDDYSSPPDAEEVADAALGADPLAD